MPCVVDDVQCSLLLRLPKTYVWHHYGGFVGLSHGQAVYAEAVSRDDWRQGGFSGSDGMEVPLCTAPPDASAGKLWSSA
jgi:hypothetical protein